jgi:hypothetical protein
MKKIKIGNKLSLNKQKVSTLNEVMGGKAAEIGVPGTHYKICATGCVCYTSIGPSCGIYCATEM